MKMPVFYEGDSRIKETLLRGGGVGVRLMTLANIQEQAYANAKAKDLKLKRHPLEWYALIHGEVSEAAEESRSVTSSEAETLELADVIIMACCYAESRGYNLDSAVKKKMTMNAERMAGYRKGRD